MKKLITLLFIPLLSYGAATNIVVKPAANPDTLGEWAVKLNYTIDQVNTNTGLIGGATLTKNPATVNQNMAEYSITNVTDVVTTNGASIVTNAADIQTLEANAISSNLWVTVRDAATNALTFSESNSNRIDSAVNNLSNAVCYVVDSGGTVTYYNSLVSASTGLGATDTNSTASGFSLNIIKPINTDVEVSFYGSDFTIYGNNIPIIIDRNEVVDEGAALTLRGTNITVNALNLQHIVRDGFDPGTHCYSIVYGSVWGGAAITYVSTNINFNDCNIEMIDLRTVHTNNAAFAAVVGSDAMGCSFTGGSIGAYEADPDATVKGHFYSYHANTTPTLTNGTTFTEVKIYMSEHTDATEINTSGGAYLLVAQITNCWFNRQTMNWYSGGAPASIVTPSEKLLTYPAIKSVVPYYKEPRSRIYYAPEFTGSSGIISVLTSPYHYKDGSTPANGFRTWGFDVASNTTYKVNAVALSKNDFWDAKNLRARMLYLTIEATTTSEGYNVKLFTSGADFDTPSFTQDTPITGVSIGSSTNVIMEWGEWRELTDGISDLSGDWSGYMTFGSSSTASTQKYLIMAVEVAGDFE